MDAVELKTKRLVLRPFSLADVEDVFEYATSPGWGKYLLRPPKPYMRRDAEESVARSLLMPWDSHPRFAMVLDGKVIGSISVRVEADNQRAEVSYSLSSYQWGKGLMPEALKGVLTWAFDAYNLRKVFARIHVDNKQSRRVAEKLGMKLEGILRAHEVFVSGEEPSDVCYYGILWHELSA